MVIVSKPESSFCRTMSFMRCFLCCYWLLLVVIASEAKQSTLALRKMDCFVACAPLRKRSAFVAGNDGKLFLHQRATRQFERLERLIAGDGREQFVVVPAAFGFRGLLDLEQIHVVHHAAVFPNQAVCVEHHV